MGAKRQLWLRHLFAAWCHDPQTMTPEDGAEYVRAHQQSGAVMGACNDHRAGAEDVAQDQAHRNERIECPVLALWGESFDWVGKAFDMEKVRSGFADDLRAARL